MRTAAALILLALFLAACGGGDDAKKAATTPAPTGPFAYDRGAPVQVQKRRVAGGEGGTVHELSYTSPRGGRVPGFLVVPTGAGKHPAVILMHGAGGDRNELLGLAAGLAARGVTALTIDSPVARTAQQTIPAGLEGVRRRRALLEQEVFDLRRAADVLDAEPEVDASRLGFLGFSAGARSGAILAGVERRIGSFVLVSGGAAPVSEYVKGASPQLREELLPELIPVDPLRWIGRARPNSIFFLNGRKDQVVPRKALRALVSAAPKPQRVRWYDTGHSPNGRMQADAIDWLAERLGAKKR